MLQIVAIPTTRIEQQLLRLKDSAGNTTEASSPYGTLKVGSTQGTTY